MRKIIYVLIVATGMICFFACGKSVPDKYACTNALPFSDSAALLSFAADSIHPSMDPSGLFYQIIDSGSSVHPIGSTIMTVTYTGRYLTGQIFDSASNTNLGGNALQNLLVGWQIGLPKIGVGGHIKLLIPSAYAYGCTGYGPVGPNSPLYFDIRLLSVN